MIVMLKKIASSYWLIILLSMVSIVPLLSVSPLIQNTPPRDSGFFLYASARLLKGDYLYKVEQIGFIALGGLGMSNE
jgi:hypothetical protein